MAIDPTNSIAEVLGRPSALGFDPAALNYECPYIGSTCTKRGGGNDGSYPVCTIAKNGKPICVCPKRFYAIDFLKDVVDHAWPGQKPDNPQIAREVQMTGFGNVDFVVADVGGDSQIKQFLSVELQAIDISGTVRDAYDAMLEGRTLEKKKAYGPNWKNVYKRFVSQLISKGYYHHHWGTKIVAVLQDDIYDYICNDAHFAKFTDISDQQVNIIFMSYKYVAGKDGSYTLELDKVEGTGHTNLLNAILYKPAPTRAEFCRKISQALARNDG